MWPDLDVRPVVGLLGQRTNGHAPHAVVRLLGHLRHLRARRASAHLAGKQPALKGQGRPSTEAILRYSFPSWAPGAKPQVRLTSSTSLPGAVASSTR